MSIVCTRLCTQNTWPSRSSSRRMASTATRSSQPPTNVRIGCRSAGGVCSSDMSRMPTRLISSVRGIGVAVSVSTSTLCFSFFIVSFACTPKRCSSSTTSKPRSLNSTPSCSSRCVPITQSTSPFFKPSMHLLRFLGREEAAEHLDANRVAGEAVGERVAVLRSQQRGRCQHRDLLAVLDRLERSTDGDLGLAEADVAADQPVHRVGALHVDLDFVDRLALIGRLDERERLLHLVLPRRVHARTHDRRR